MSEEDRKKEKGEISRRDFLNDAGFVVGGAAIGAGIAYPLIPGEETIVEVPGETIYVDVPVDVPKFICPYDSQEFDTFGALTAHVADVHAEAEPVTIIKFTCPYDSQEFDTLATLGAHLNAVHGGESPAPTDGEVVVEAIPGAVTLTVNGKSYLRKVKPNWSLVFVLREKLGLTGTKIGCDRGSCGTCTVIVDGRPVYSCMMLAIESEGKDILTVEGLSDGITLHPVQQAFVDNDAVQCGYCIPGYIMTAKALLDNNSSPTRDEVREALSGHICICGNTKKIVDAVL